MNAAETETGILHRTFTFDRRKANKKTRTVEIAFSSEQPVKRWWGEMEILSHATGDYDLARLNDGAPLLLNHDSDQQIGVIESARIDSDKVGRAVVRFGNSDLAEEIFRDVLDGIRSKASFGYEHSGLLRTTEKEGQQKIGWYRWAAYEISIVPVPADSTVGVGRSHSKPSTITRQMDPEETTTTNHEISALAAEYIKDWPHLAQNIRAEKMRALSEGTAPREFSRAMLKLVQANPPPENYLREVDHEVGLSRKEIQEYSFARAIRSAVQNNGKIEGYEKEVSIAVAKKCGRDPEGFYVASDVVLGGSRRDYLKRDMQATLFGAGGALVPTQIMIPVIDLLRNRAICGRLGATILAGLSGNLAWPRQVAPGTAQSLAEIGLLTASQQTFDQILMSPKRIGAQTVYSKQLVLQSSPDIEAVIRNDLFAVVGLRWDAMLLNGQGAASEPQGIVNTPGVGSITFGGAVAFDDVVDMETDVAVANADMGRLAYATAPRVKGALKKTAVNLAGATTVSSRSIWEDIQGDEFGDGTVNGKLAASSSQVSNNLVLYGNWQDEIWGIWGGLDVVVDQFTQAARAEIIVTVNTWGDGALRHPQSFIVSADAGNQ